MVQSRNRPHCERDLTLSNVILRSKVTKNLAWVGLQARSFAGAQDDKRKKIGMTSAPSKSFWVMQNSRCERGFTIIEILGVIVLIGIVAAVTVPTFKSTDIDVTTAAATIQSDINFAQNLALSRNPATAGSIGITFTVGASSYTITDPSGVFTQTRTLPTTVSVTQGGTISFNKYGEPEFAGTSLEFKVNAGGKTQTLTVEQYTGRVTVA